MSPRVSLSLSRAFGFSIFSLFGMHSERRALRADNYLLCKHSIKRIQLEVAVLPHLRLDNERPTACKKGLFGAFYGAATQTNEVVGRDHGIELTHNSFFSAELMMSSCGLKLHCLSPLECVKSRLCGAL